MFTFHSKVFVLLNEEPSISNQAAGETDLSVTEPAASLETHKLNSNTKIFHSHFRKPVNYADDPKLDRYDSTKKNLESIRACVHQVQLADNEERSTAWKTKITSGEC